MCSVFIRLKTGVHLRFIVLISSSSTFSDSFLSLSSALTVLKQELPFGSDQPKKIVKTSTLNKEQIDEIAQIDQTTNAATADNNKNHISNAGGSNPAGVATAPTAISGAIAIACHINGVNNSNSNSSTSHELANCLESVAAQHQSHANDQNDEQHESNNSSMWCLQLLFISEMSTNVLFVFYCRDWPLKR